MQIYWVLYEQGPKTKGVGPLELEWNFLNIYENTTVGISRPLVNAILSQFWACFRASLPDQAEKKYFFKY